MPAISKRFILLCLYLACVWQGYGQQAMRKGHDYAVFFVASTFEQGWTKLPDAPKEADRIAEELKNRYGFEVQIVPNARRSDIVKVLTAYKLKKYDPQDQLLLFFFDARCA